MTIKILRLLCLLVLSYASFGQDKNLYDLENSLKFARFLDQKGNHSLAILEWERINMMQPNSDSLQFALIRSYRQAGDFQGGIKRFDLLFPDHQQYHNSIDLGQEMARLLFLNQDFGRLKVYIQNHHALDLKYKQVAEVSLALRDGNAPEAKTLYANYQLQEIQLEQLISQGEDLPYKNKALAVAMSTIVPGSGKAYLRNWQDGLVSLLFIGGSAYASYRGFNQEGINSAYGWIFGTISTGFYLGNIFGTAKATNKYNRGILEHYQADVETFLYRRL